LGALRFQELGVDLEDNPCANLGMEGATVHHQ